MKTTTELATYLGVHPNIIRSFVKQGKLKAIQLGPRTWRFKDEDVKDFMDNHSSMVGV